MLALDGCDKEILRKFGEELKAKIERGEVTLADFMNLRLCSALVFLSLSREDTGYEAGSRGPSRGDSSRTDTV